MPKEKKADSYKVQAAVMEFPKEFVQAPNKLLYCKLCNCTVTCTKRFFIENHRKSGKHQRQLNQETSRPAPQGFLKVVPMDFAEKVCEAFLSADIPLHKLNNRKLKELFEGMGNPLPSQTTCWRKVQELGEKELEKVQVLIKDEEIFMVVDESDIANKQYLNILVGKIARPEKTYLVECKPLCSSPNKDIICQAVDDISRQLNVKRGNFCLLLSDAASYMKSAGATLKQLYPRLFHVTCMAHLLHNCAMKIKSHFPEVDNLIARVKAATVRNKVRKAMFSSIGYPPQPVVTRWASWLQAAFYYADHLPEVSAIVANFEGSGVLVTKAQQSVQAPLLNVHLLEIKEQYSELASLVSRMEAATYTIKEAVVDVKRISFKEDVCHIAAYIAKRLKDSDIDKIITLARPEIEPSLYGKLQRCQATSASVERSFSMLGKLLAKDRQFSEENLRHYLAVHYNSLP